MNIPLEFDEAVAFADWCNYKQLDCYHIPNENTIKNFAFIQKMKRQNWKKGISDYLIYVPSEACKYGKAIILFIELKRRRRIKKNGEVGASPSVVSPEQLKFIENMNKVSSVQGQICYGSSECIEFVSRFLI